MREPACAPSGDRLRLRLRYQPFYCEENIWWLCAEPPTDVRMAQVIFVASQGGACPIAEQRAGGAAGLVWWDYHCIALDEQRRIWDLDSRLPLPVAAGTWLERSFPHAARLPAWLQPCFRVVAAAHYLADFASDRRHMRSADGGWLQAPPPWPCIGAGNTLSGYRQPGDPAGPGQRLDLDAFKAFVG
ncbi:MAG: hypothetical protein ACLFTD_07805 [Halochromatium sp.]